jgi:SAM-dependent methyltransferase
MKLVALYKTFDGGEFVDASLASIYDYVDAIVMVHSDVSWLGERGNRVRPDALSWCEKFDKAGKVHHIDVELTSQEEQYAFGVGHITRYNLGDIIMVVDADEVWEAEYIENAKRQIHDKPFAAYRCNMHTYLKSPFYRVDPPYGSPTVFLRDFRHLTTSPRGCKAPALQLSDVWMHHFTAVRETREAVERKIHQSCLADKNNEQVVPDWMTKVYDRLPDGNNLHYFVKHVAKWQRVKKITDAELPAAMRTAKLLPLWWSPPAPAPVPIDVAGAEHAAVMGQAAKIRDVAKRHSFVFDAGHSVADFFDVEKRMKSEEFAVLRKHVKAEWDVIEVGCYTGLNLIGLAREGHQGWLTGVDFVQGAIDWLKSNWPLPNGLPRFAAERGEFPEYVPTWSPYDCAICFDVLEHQRNQGQFLEGVSRILKPGGTALVLVPKGADYYDVGHVGFFPNEETLRNVLDYVFDVAECYELASCNKIFAVCRKRS